MTRRRFETSPGATMPAIRRAILAAVGVLAGIVCLAGPASAQNNIDQGRRQFEKAVSLRTELESHPQGQRTLEAYRQVVAAYKKVYAYTSDAEIVTPSLVASAELSSEVGGEYAPG